MHHRSSAPDPEIVVIDDDDDEDTHHDAKQKTSGTAAHGAGRKWKIKRPPAAAPRTPRACPTSSSSSGSGSSTSSSSSSSFTPPSTASTPAPTAPKEIPGYYYDPRLNRYFKKDPFRPQPAHTLPAAAVPSTATAPKTQQPALRYSLGKLLHAQQSGLITSSAFRRRETQALASRWRERETEREGPAFVPTDVDDIALHKDGLLLMGHKGGAVTLDACCMKRDQEDLCMAFYSSRLRHVYASPISSLRWAPGSAGQSALFAVGLFGGYNLPGSVDIRGVDFQSRTGINLNKGSLWCAEWKPQASHVALGVTQGAMLFDITTSRVTTMWTKKSDVFAQGFDSTGNTLFNGSRDGMVRGVDLRANPREARDGSHHPIIMQKSPVCCVKILHDDNYLVVSSFNGKIQRWDRRLVRPVVAYGEHVNQYTHLSFTLAQDYSLLIAGGQDKLLRIWDLRSGQLLQQLRPFTQHIIKNVAFGDDWKLARGDVVGRTFLPALILPSLDWFSFPGG